MLKEIETYSYPPFISKVTGSILEDKSNQYFITTHSPYVVNDFIENHENDVAIYLAELTDGKTIIRSLADQEIDEVNNVF